MTSIQNSGRSIRMNLASDYVNGGARLGGPQRWFLRPFRDSDAGLLIMRRDPN